MNKALLDANVIIRYLLGDDEKKRAECASLFRAAKENRLSLILPPIVVYEVVWVLERTYKIDRKKISEVIKALLNTPEFECDSADMLRVALDTYGKKNVKFGDAVIASWGQERGIDVIYTYDEKDFKKIGGIEVRKP